jgi:16S rRNA (uracil1498-N3)-methyltransferase
VSHRFRFIGARASEGRWELAGDEAHHATKVLRLGVGAAVEVTDGRGVWGVGTVASATAKAVIVELTEREKIEAAAAQPFVLALGALKPGDVDETLPSLVELGVDELWIFRQEGVAKARTADKAVERWERIVRQSVKQCKRAWIPRLAVFDDVAGIVREASGRALQRIVLTVAADALARVRDPQRGALVVCGGEKGLAPEEERALREAGFAAAGLGPHVLRAVTAAIAAAAVAGPSSGGL